MPTKQPSISLTIDLTQEQLGFLAYLYPNEDPEEALIKLLERDRSRAIRRAEQQVRVLHPGQETEHQEKAPETASTQITEGVENPIGELQELCQRQQISMPVYEFEELAEGFHCAVQAMGLLGVGLGRSKKEAKIGAAGELLSLLGRMPFSLDAAVNFVVQQ